MNVTTEESLTTDLTTGMATSISTSLSTSTSTDMSTDVTTMFTGTTDELSETAHVFDSYSVFIHPHWYQFPLVSPGWHYFIGVFITIVGITGVCGNALVIYIFTKVRTLRTPSNMFIVNLAISDMTFSIVNGFPLLSLSAFSKKWIFGQAACEFYGLIGGVFGLMSINTMATIAIDRYYAIAKPLEMTKKMTRKRAFLMIVVVWLWSLASSLPPIFGWGRYIPEGFQTSCTFDYLTRTDNNRTYMAFMYIQGFLVPLFIIIVCYAMILKAINKHENEMKKTAKKLNAEMRSNQDKTRMEIKVAKVAMALVLQYLLSWTPYATVALIGQFGDANFVTPFWSEIPVMFAKASAMHNPIMYALSHPKFREALNQHLPWLLCCCKPKEKPNLQAGSNRDTTRRPGLTSQMSESSAVSNLSDTNYADMEVRLRRLENDVTTSQLKGTALSAGNDDVNSGKIIQDLTKVILEISAQNKGAQPVQPVYLPRNALKQTDKEGSGDKGGEGVYVLDSNTLPELANYLAKFSNLNSNADGGVNNPGLDLSPESPTSDAVKVTNLDDKGARPKTNNLNIKPDDTDREEEHKF